MLEGKGMVKDSDMPLELQVEAMSFASQALDLFDVSDYRSIARHMKMGLDKKYGSGWQCVVGSSFGCYFTHVKESFIYFHLESINFLIFRGAPA